MARRLVLAFVMHAVALQLLPHPPRCRRRARPGNRRASTDALVSGVDCGLDAVEVAARIREKRVDADADRRLPLVEEEHQFAGAVVFHPLPTGTLGIDVDHRAKSGRIASLRIVHVASPVAGRNRRASAARHAAWESVRGVGLLDVAIERRQARGARTLAARLATLAAGFAGL